MTSPQKPFGYWNKERCTEAAKKCKTRKQFSIEERSAYGAAVRCGFLDEICIHMEETKLPRGYWSKDRCAMAALTCKSRSEFFKKYQSAANAALNGGFYEEICQHIPPLGNLTKRCIYIIVDAKTRCVYVGLTYNFNKRNHSKDRSEIAGLRERGKYVMIKDYMPASEAVREERRIIKKLRDSGAWNVLNRSSGGQLGTAKKLKQNKPYMATL